MAEQRRYEEIVRIQTYLAEGVAPVRIKDILHTTYYRIRRYARGDPLNLCRFTGGEREPGASQYRDKVVSLLMQNTPKKDMLVEISMLGYRGQRTAFEAYCRKLIVELGISYQPRRNSAGVPISTSDVKPLEHFVPTTDFLRYLWSGETMELADVDYIARKHPRVLEIQQCILDFRKVYNEKSVVLLEYFIERYSSSSSKPIQSFACGLRSDFEAVKNSVISELSNGFVEGNNNKIKAIKRMMYGRAKIDLLRVKVLYAR